MSFRNRKSSEYGQPKGTPTPSLKRFSNANLLFTLYKENGEPYKNQEHQVWYQLRKLAFNDNILTFDSEHNDEIYPHLLRHTRATHMLDEGSTIHKVKRALGHSKIRTTELYNEISERQIATAFADNEAEI